MFTKIVYGEWEYLYLVKTVFKPCLAEWPKVYNDQHKYAIIKYISG